MKKIFIDLLYASTFNEFFCFPNCTFAVFLVAMLVQSVTNYLPRSRAFAAGPQWPFSSMVEGIGVLWPGAGTLRGLFSTRDPSGGRVLDEEAWEASIQKVLDACKEFDVPCGYPANENDIEMRIEQGFSVFVMNWGESGFRTIDVGRQASGR